jgi:streptogramin lyase
MFAWLLAAAVAQTIWVTPASLGYPESIIVAPDGAITLSVVFSGKVYARSADGNVKTIAALSGMEPGQPGFICIVRGEDGSIYATALRARGEVWRIAENGHAPELVATLPEGAQPNGIATDGNGGLIVGDNVSGLWHVVVQTGQSSRWLEHTLLRRTPSGRLPAANGVQRHGKMLYVTNSDKALLVKVQIGANGTAKKVFKAAEGAPGDDFAVDTDGTAYVTTHPSNTVLRVRPSAQPEVFADINAPMDGPTAATIATIGGRRWLYVATDGGAFANGGKPRTAPTVIRLALPSIDQTLNSDGNQK